MCYTFFTMAKFTLKTLPTDQLQPNPFQPRGKIANEDIVELVKSIQKYGILEPLVVAQTPAGYQIIAGERRWRAAREAGLDEVPVHVKKTTPKGMLEMAIIENVQRVDLSAIERAQAFKQLMRDFGFSHKEIAERIGKSTSYVSNTIHLLRLPDAVTDGLVGGLITEGHARALNGLTDEKTMIECYKIVLKENASVRRCEELVRRFKEKMGQEEDGRGKPAAAAHTPELDQWVKDLQAVFQKRSNVKMSRSSRQTKITITLKGSPEETQADLDKIIALSKVEIN